ncbi:MAG TPA: hypothetical protein VFG39_01020, partial [Balneolaceae bacterium]|nr:hypothetical protein [Balneolaceae bacterium]
DISDKPNYLANVTGYFREIYGGTIITSANYDRESGMEAIAEGKADLVAFGRLFLANPDLPQRFETDAELNEPNRDTFYGGSEEGYIDYPFMDEVQQKRAS